MAAVSEQGGNVLVLAVAESSGSPLVVLASDGSSLDYRSPFGMARTRSTGAI